MSNLEHDLVGAGFTPVHAGLHGVVAWTGWQAPVQKDAYEMYYDRCQAAMYAQMDDPPWGRYHPGHQHRVGGRCPVLNCLVREYRAVVDCWRSASQVPPAPRAL